MKMCLAKVSFIELYSRPCRFASFAAFFLFFICNQMIEKSAFAASQSRNEQLFIPPPPPMTASIQPMNGFSSGPTVVTDEPHFRNQTLNDSFSNAGAGWSSSNDPMVEAQQRYSKLFGLGIEDE